MVYNEFCMQFKEGKGVGFYAVIRNQKGAHFVLRVKELIDRFVINLKIAGKFKLS